MQTFEKSAQRAFVDEIFQELMQDYPHKAFREIGEAKLFIQLEIERAIKEYKIISKVALKKYVCASWLLSRPLDNEPHIKLMLSRTDLAPYVRALFALNYVQGNDKYYGLW